MCTKPNLQYISDNMSVTIHRPYKFPDEATPDTQDKGYYIRVALRQYARYVDMDSFIAFVYMKFVEFTKEVMDFTLYPPQMIFAKRIIHDVIYGRIKRVYILCSRQSGKTQTMAWIVAFLSYYLPLWYTESRRYNNEVTQKLYRFRSGFWGGIFAPGKTQAGFAYDRTREIMRIIKTKYAMKMKMDRSDLYALDNGSLVRLFTASEGANIEGFTGHLLYIDECQSVVDTMINKSIIPMGTHTRAMTVMSGTPTLTIEEGCRIFYEATTDPNKDSDVYRTRWEEIAKYNADYGAYVEQQKLEMGHDNPEFLAAYELVWPSEGVTFTSREILDELGDKDLKRIREAIKNKIGMLQENIYAGIDVGKKGDNTVVCVVQAFKGDDGFPALKILNWLEVPLETTYDKQEEMLYEFLNHYALSGISLDATGVGENLYDHLRRMFGDTDTPSYNRNVHIGRYIFTQRSHSEIFSKLHEMWYRRSFAYPWDESIECRHFRKQFKDLGLTMKGSFMSCHHPERADAHDDYCTALALTLDAMRFDMLQPEASLDTDVDLLLDDTSSPDFSQIDSFSDTSFGDQTPNFSRRDW